MGQPGVGPLTHTGWFGVAAQCTGRRRSPRGGKPGWPSESEQAEEGVHVSGGQCSPEKLSQREVRRTSCREDARLVMNRGTDQTMLVY